MKREELKIIDLLCDMGIDVNGNRNLQPWKAYDIDEVNLAIDALEAENERLKARCEKFNEWRGSWHNMMKEAVHEIRTLRKENEQLEAEKSKAEMLVLHSFSKLFVYMNIHYHTLLKSALEDEHDFNQTPDASIKYKRKCEKTLEQLIKYDELYRKAKKELK